MLIKSLRNYRFLDEWPLRTRSTTIDSATCRPVNVSLKLIEQLFSLRTFNKSLWFFEYPTDIRYQCRTSSTRSQKLTIARVDAAVFNACSLFFFVCFYFFFPFFFSFYIVRALRRSTNVRSIVLTLLDASGVEATLDQRQWTPMKISTFERRPPYTVHASFIMFVALPNLILNK